MDSPLGTAFSRVDALKRQLYDMLTNPRDAAAMLGGRIVESGQQAQALQEQTFGDPNRPFRVTDPQAMARLTDMLMAGPMGFAPAGTVSRLPSKSLLEQPLQSVESMFETGKEITFPFIKNTEKAPKTMGFGQKIEPAGNYILSGENVDVAKLPQGWIFGEVTFKNPLVLDWGKSGLYSEPDNWKQVLSNRYGGKTGKALSKAVAKDGYDGIVTINEYGPSEIVDLTMFAKNKN